MSTKETENLPQDAESTTESTPRPASPQRTQSDSTMSSPHSARKRTHEEIYPSKPDKIESPRSKKLEKKRPNTAPDQNAISFKIAGNASSQFGREALPVFTKPLAYMPSSQSLRGLTLQAEGSNLSAYPEFKGDYVRQIQEMQAEHEAQYERFTEDLPRRDRTQPLVAYKWDEFESKYLQNADTAIREEQDKAYAMAMRYKHMLVWMQTSSEREAQRAIKRLRTRIAYVQRSEEELARKQAHQTKVFNAFQSAMSLLHNF